MESAAFSPDIWQNVSPFPLFLVSIPEKKEDLKFQNRISMPRQGIRRKSFSAVSHYIDGIKTDWPERYGMETLPLRWNVLLQT